MASNIDSDTFWQRDTFLVQIDGDFAVNVHRHLLQMFRQRFGVAVELDGRLRVSLDANRVQAGNDFGFTEAFQVALQIILQPMRSIRGGLGTLGESVPFGLQHLGFSLEVQIGLATAFNFPHSVDSELVELGLYSGQHLTELVNLVDQALDFCGQLIERFYNFPSTLSGVQEFRVCRRAARFQPKVADSCKRRVWGQLRPKLGWLLRPGAWPRPNRPCSTFYLLRSSAILGIFGRIRATPPLDGLPCFRLRSV